MKFEKVARSGIALVTVAMVAIGLGWPDSIGAAETNIGGPVSADPLGPTRVMSDTEASPTGMRVLYAPSDNDNPAFRAAIARMSGATVDYIDTRTVTPSSATLAGYDCVFTYVNFAYANNVQFGDNLAAAVDAGKTTVLLGSFSVPTGGNALGGAILTAGYSPVLTPTGVNHFLFDSWSGDGVAAFTEGVVDFGATYRDDLALQGSGQLFSSYLDGEIAVASRNPDWKVTYLNGAVGPEWNEGDWPMLVANSCRAGSFDVLIYDENTNNHWAAGSMGTFAANYSVVGSSQFNTFLTDPTRDWDLVLVDCPSNPPLGGFDDLIAYVNAGGKAVMSYYYWNDPSAYPALAAAFGYTGTSSIMLDASDYYEAAGTPGGAHVHAGIAGLPSNTWVGSWGDDGDVFSLAPGSDAIGVISGGAVSGPVVIQNPAGNAIAAFALDSWGSDQAEELWRNMAARVLDRSYLDGAAISAQWLYPDTGTVLEEHQFVVKPTTDLTADEILSSNNHSINLHGPYIHFQFVGNSNWTPQPFNGWQFIDHTGELPDIGSAWFVNIDPNVTGLDPHAIEHGDSRVRVNFSGMIVTAPADIRIEVFFGLWADGFETGDTLRWASTVGGP